MSRKGVNKKDWDTSKFFSNKKHEMPFAKITLNRVKKHVSDEGQKVIRTCENESLKYQKFQNIEKEVEDHTEDWLSKKRVATSVSSRIMGSDAGMRRGLRVVKKEKRCARTSKKNRPMVKAEADKDSDTLIETFHCAYEAEN